MDELIKRLRAAKVVVFKSEDVSLLGEAADAIEELQGKHFLMTKTAQWLAEKVPKWIPVTERLPEEAGCYLVAVKNDHQRRYSKTAWFSHGSWFARQDVTHWMPLPPAPKEE